MVFRLFGGLVLSGLLLGCGSQDSKLAADERIELSFAQWCAGWELTACDTEVDESYSEESWQFGQVALEQFLQSPSEVEFSRKVYESTDLKNFLDSLGSTSLTELIAELPWETLRKEDDRLILSSKEKRQITINNAIIEIAKTLSIETVKTGYYRVVGLRLRETAGDSYYISRLDLRKPGLMTLSGKSLRVKNIPSKFLIGDEQISSPDAAKFNSSLPGVLFSDEFDWRELGGLVLKDDQLDVFAENADLFKESLPDPQYLSELQFLVESMRTLRLGGKQKDGRVLYAGFEKAVSCTATIVNIPLVGQLSFDLNFAEQTGLGRLQKTRRGLEMTAFGLNTTIGKISRIKIEGETLTIRIGFVNLPIDISEKPEREGQPELDSLSCR